MLISNRFHVTLTEEQEDCQADQEGQQLPPEKIRRQGFVNEPIYAL
jgi:hypothetical protein